MDINFDWYRRNAGYYDLFDADGIPYEAISIAFGKILRKNGVNAIVDFGCGTGNFYIPLTQLGFELLGVDVSAEMISIAKGKIIANNFKPNLIQSDIRSPITGNFDAALCLYNVIGDLNYQDFSKVIGNMVKLIRKNGLVGFDVINFDGIKNVEFGNKYSVEEKYESESLGKLIRRTKQKLDLLSQSLDIAQHTTVNGKTDKKSISRCTMYLYTLEQVTNLLNKYGLHALLLYGSYDITSGLVPFKSNDPMIGVIAQKIYD